MGETILNTGIVDAITVDPSQIGGASKRRQERGLFFRQKWNLTDEEIEDLLKIDPGKIGLDDVREYATNHVIYYESMGKVRLNSIKEKDFREAKMVSAWLNKREYRKAAAFFLQKAKENWQGKDFHPTDSDEVVWKIFGAEDVLTIPWSVQKGGDNAIRQFLSQKRSGLTLRMASKSSVSYLRQASVLVRALQTHKSVKWEHD